MRKGFCAFLALMVFCLGCKPLWYSEKRYKEGDKYVQNGLLSVKGQVRIESTGQFGTKEWKIKDVVVAWIVKNNGTRQVDYVTVDWGYYPMKDLYESSKKYCYSEHMVLIKSKPLQPGETREIAIYSKKLKKVLPYVKEKSLLSKSCHEHRHTIDWMPHVVLGKKGSKV